MNGLCEPLEDPHGLSEERIRRLVIQLKDDFLRVSDVQVSITQQW